VFELGKVYRRRDLHNEFGGQQQGGIVTSKSTPIGPCPSCHRRAHYADDGEAFNKGLIAWLRSHEGAI
jgi:hypothetical protein